MQVTTKLSVDMARPNIGTRVNAVQGDGNTRFVEITLLSGGMAWEPPEGVEAAIAYYLPNGRKGLYNKLADDTAAISISGNVVTIILAPQMLTASGTVQATLVFSDAQLNRLTTFPFSVAVTRNPAAGAQETEDYIRLQWLEDKLQALKDSGVFDGHTPEYGVDYGTAEQIAGIAQQAANILQPAIEQLKDDLDTLFDNMIPLFTNAVYASEGMDVYLDNLKNRVHQNPDPEPDPEPNPDPEPDPEPSEPALYPFANGTHTFADGSILTVSNGNHVRFECKTASTVGSATNPLFGFSDVVNANYSSANAVYDNLSQYSATPLFTLNEGDSAEITVKNISCTDDKYTFQINMRECVTNGKGIMSEPLAVNYTTGDPVSRTFVVSTTKNVAPFYVYFKQSKADAIYEFDVELYVNGTRYV